MASLLNVPSLYSRVVRCRVRMRQPIYTTTTVLNSAIDSTVPCERMFALFAHARKTYRRYSYLSSFALQRYGVDEKILVGIHIYAVSHVKRYTVLIQRSFFVDSQKDLFQKSIGVIPPTLSFSLFRMLNIL